MTEQHRPSRRGANRLAQETSPYLLQHAQNPVDWHPWGPEALEKARALDRPILLSIGYAACHWCHVMERESFEDDAIAALMNEHFICIKVDREERPDLDEIYMAATVALSGSGGWPMTVFLTPDQQPFFAGTYFPPEDRYGRPGFPTLLGRVQDLWRDDRATLLDQAEQLTQHVRGGARAVAPAGISRDAVRRAFKALAQEYDEAYGGFGSAPKFPPSASLSLLLRYHRTSGDPQALAMVRGTLDAMKNGGLYDQLGGGFARYSVDERWLVPHFEKMLYDNAQLIDVYLEAYAITGDAEYARVARESLDYVTHEMQSPAGGYFSSGDADSEGEEGKFFVWRHDEVRALLDEPLAERFCHYYDVTPAGNWEGKSVLNTPRSLAQCAADLGVSAAELEVSLDEARAQLREARAARVAPGIDDKVLVAWNGLMIRAMAAGYRALGDERYLRSAERAARYLLTQLRRPDGGLYRTARGERAHLAAYLEDYAFLSDGLVSLYEVSGDLQHLAAARELAERLIQDFADPKGGAFFHTAQDHEELLVRPREGHDGALPNPNAVACRALARLAVHLDRDDLRQQALQAALSYGRLVSRQPRAFATLLGAVDFLLEPPLELVLAGAPDDPAFIELQRAVARHYLPQRVEARAPQGDVDDPRLPPLVRGKTLIDGRPALYLCEGFACQAPLTRPEDVASALDALDVRQRERAASELGPQRTHGRATAAGTARRAARSALREQDYAPLRLGTPEDPDGTLLVSRLGFGSYRVGLDQPDHRAALSTALEQGLNLLDTAPSFALGDSERMIGDVLGRLIREHSLSRDEVVLVTKVGVAQGGDRERIEARARSGRPFHNVLELNPETEGGALFCLDPDFLDAQLSGSLNRLALDHVELCLLSNPEHWLLSPLTQQLAEQAGVTALQSLRAPLARAFQHLETEVARGRIGAYGVATNTAARDPAAPGALALEWLLEVALEAAQGVGLSHSHFRVIELPLNAVEHAAAAARDGAPSLIERAAAAQVCVLANRPLSAISEEALVRLAEPPSPSGQPPDLELARGRVAALEADFEATLAPALRVAGALGREQLFQFGGRVGEAVEASRSLEQFNQLEATLIMPRLRAMMGQLDRAFSGPAAGSWTQFKNRYIDALGAWLASAREHAADGNRRLLDDLEQKLRYVGVLRDAWDGAFGGAPWTQRALALARDVEGVTCVLVGARRREQVLDAVASLSVPAGGALRAVASSPDLG